MKLPISWLKDFVDIEDIEIDYLKNKLFSCGFEVEEVVVTGSHISNIVAAKIEQINKHPNADKLSVCMVDVNQEQLLQIVTNATNIKVGDVVALALVDAVLNDGSIIKFGEVRNVASYGMFCSGAELGINDFYFEGASVDGILILPQDTPLGSCIKELVGLNECIFDINVTANRPDCQSILGLAREVASVLGRSLKMPKLSYNKCSKLETKNKVLVEVIDNVLCPRYIAHYVQDIKIESSPLWIKRRLINMGIKPINNIVDITNYVLLEIGQPMHAFDYSKISGNKIVVRPAFEQESLITLDDKKLNLNATHLVICDETKPIALAGVMGGLESSINQDTVEIVFESATFKRDSVRRTSKAVGLKSDSSARFEKGVDAYSNEIGINRALSLLSLITKSRIASSSVDVFCKGQEEKVVKTKISKINALLGIEIPAEKIKQILKSLYFKVEIDGDRLIATAPPYREDVENYPDLAEEVIRIYGYDKIEPTFLEKASVTQGGKTQKQKFVDSIKNIMQSMGGCETVTYSFVSPTDLKEFDDKSHKIKLLNPLGEDLSIMRTTLVPSLVKVAANNIKRKNTNFTIFEIASTYHTKEKTLTTLPNENLELCVVISSQNATFFTAKAIVENIFINQLLKAQYLPATKTFLHSGRSANIVLGNENIGYVGQLSYQMAEEFGIDKDVFVLSIDLDLMFNHLNNNLIYQNIAKYPSIDRDLAIVVKDDVTWSQIEKIVTKSAGHLLKQIKPFDIYKGKGVAEGYKSVAFSMVFNSLEKTLSIEEVDKIIAQILQSLQAVGALLRGIN